MAAVDGKLHDGGSKKSRPSGQKANKRKLPGTCVYEHADKYCPDKVVTGALEHQPKGRTQKQIPEKHRNGTSERKAHFFFQLRTIPFT